MLSGVRTRRQFLQLALAGCGSLGAVLASRQVGSQRQLHDKISSDRRFDVSDDRTLKQRAAAKGLLYGVAVRSDQLRFDAEFATSVAQESRLLVPEWALKWRAGNQLLRPALWQYDFSAVDEMLAFARAHDLLLRGHTLVWHESLPDWFDRDVSVVNAHQTLTHHIQTVVSKYAGQVHSWDVVNEAIAYDPRKSKRSDQLRLTPWLEFLGPDYIDLAFRTASAADPEALLVYNEFGLDSDTPLEEAKRSATLNLLKSLKEKGTPIHALGIQSHLRADGFSFNPQKLRQFLRQVADLGLKIMITELDVSDQGLPADVAQRDRIIAAVYEDYLSVVLDEPAVMAVITWGLSDRYTFLSEFSPRSDGKSVRPLPLDENLQPKLAWNAIARAFDAAPQRR